MSTRESNLGYIRRTIKAALGSTQVRKVRGPLLDTLYARLMRDTKTHQERHIAIDPVTCALIQETLDETTTGLATVGVSLAPAAFLFSNDPAHSRPWNPDWVSHRVRDLAKAAGVDLDIKGIRHYTASQLLAAGFDLGNTAARLGHSGGGATTLKHYADPVSEVDRRAAAYLAQLTTRSAAQSG